MRNRGYTLIELLIVLFIMAVLLGTAVMSYRDFNRRQVVTSSARQIRADLRLAQSEALAGRKPAACDSPTRTLNSYSFRRTSNNSYAIEATCGNPDQTFPVRTANLGGGVTIDNFNTIFFKTIGDGTFLPTGSSVLITVHATGTSYTETVTVRASGDIL